MAAEARAKIRITASDEASRAISNVAKAALGFLAVNRVWDFAKDSLAEFNEGQKQSVKLQTELNNAGLSWQMPELSDYASELQNMIGIADDVVMSQLSVGLAMGLTGANLKASTAAAAGLAKKYEQVGMTSEAAMKLLARANNGDFGGFARYGIILDDTMTEQEKFNAVMNIGMEGFRTAEREADTFGGKLNQMALAWADAKEGIGSYIASTPALSEAMDWITTSMQDFGLTADYISNWAAFAFTSFFNDLSYWLTDKIPTYLINFGEYFITSWSNLSNYLGVIIGNMWGNLSTFFDAILSWIKGDGFDFHWTGLTEGFRASIAELKPITDREIGAVESILASRTAELYDQLQSAHQVRLNQQTDTDGLIAAAANQRANEGPARQLLAKNTNPARATESRFLGRSSTVKTPTDKNTGELVTLTRQLVAINRQKSASPSSLKMEVIQI